MTDQQVVIIADRLLQVLHDEAIRLETSSNPLLGNWGRHLLEDWRSLELLAERQRDPVDTTSEH
jgi:hypothetical protein